MKFKFIDIPTIKENGETSDVLVNPKHIVMLISIPIPTGLTAGDGKTPIVKPGTGIVLSTGLALPCKMARKECREYIEEKVHLL